MSQLFYLFRLIGRTFFFGPSLPKEKRLGSREKCKQTRIPIDFNLSTSFCTLNSPGLALFATRKEQMIFIRQTEEKMWRKMMFLLSIHCLLAVQLCRLDFFAKLLLFVSFSRKPSFQLKHFSLQNDYYCHSLKCVYSLSVFYFTMLLVTVCPNWKRCHLN